MKRTGILAIAVLAVATFAIGDFADAARLGGGRSLGAQRQSIAPPASTAPGAATNPVMPAQPGAGTPAKPLAPAAAAPSGMSRWLGPIAGIAAGLGLAALLSYFGLPEGFASVLLIALIVIGVVFAARMLLARRTPAKPPLQYAGASGPGSSPGGYEAQSPGSPSAPARGGDRRIEPVMPALASAAPSANFAKPLPPGFDAEGFIRQAKLQFNRLQAAYDTGDTKALSDVMTPEMTAEVARDLDARGEHHATEVVSLNAEVLEVTTEAGSYWASVRFTGLVREDGAPVPNSLDEVWNLVKPVDGSSGWLLAGIRQVA
jgi:predicted lipid-binding transport protein (Tim44 family)